MECAKDIILELKEGQAVHNSQKTRKGVFHRIFDKISKHKVMTTIILATISFMILDVILVSSFVGILIG